MISINWDRESLCREKERQRRERERVCGCVCVEGLRDRKSVFVCVQKDWVVQCLHTHFLRRGSRDLSSPDTSRPVTKLRIGTASAGDTHSLALKTSLPEASIVSWYVVAQGYRKGDKHLKPPQNRGRPTLVSCLLCREKERERESMCVDRKRDRKCVCRDKERVCVKSKRERESVCVCIESVCVERQRECVCREIESVCVQRKRERRVRV